MTYRDRQSDADTDEPRPWEEPGAVRRDCAPHRAAWLRRLAGPALVLCGAALFWGVTGLVGVPLALVLRAAAGRDLARMQAGTMDPDGRPATEHARRLAEAALWVGVTALALWALVLTGLWLRG
jgi:hypothetical protein